MLAVVPSKADIGTSFGMDDLRDTANDICIAALTMAFKLCQCAEKRWIRLHHPKRLAKVIKGKKFINSIEDNWIAA